MIRHLESTGQLFLGPGLVLLVIIISCSSQKERSASPLTRQFQAQIAASCEQIDRQIEKVVRKDPQSVGEKQILALRQPGEADTTCYLSEEMKLAVEYFYDDVYLQEAFEVSQSGDTLIADLKPGNSSVYLQEQKVIESPLGDSSVIRYLSSRVRKENWLYGLNLNLQIHFDSLGHYQQHHAELSTSVILSGGDFSGIIDMKLLPKP